MKSPQDEPDSRSDSRSRPDAGTPPEHFEHPAPSPFLKRAFAFVIGPARRLTDPQLFHKISLAAFLAWVGLGADGLSSSAYGPEAAFLALRDNTFLAIPLALMTALTVTIISASYMHIIERFPSGGGGYVVASKLLGPIAGLVSGSALLVDYVLDGRHFARELLGVRLQPASRPNSRRSSCRSPCSCSAR